MEDVKQDHRKVNTVEPPVIHATHRWDQATNTLHYDYYGISFISIAIPAGVKPYFKDFSNGNVQSMPLVQQLLFSTNQPSSVKVKFRLSADALNMRPKRALSEQAILGQVGRPLLYGVNGLYDISLDYMLEWHGTPWKWVDNSLKADAEGHLQAELEVEVGLSPWVILFRPQYYRTHLNFSNHLPWKWRPNLKPITGWSSWEAFGQKVREEDIGTTVDFLAKHLKAYGLDYIQIDDGYQNPLIPPTEDGLLSDSWLKTNDQFPSGHRGIRDKITSNGFIQGSPYLRKRLSD